MPKEIAIAAAALLSIGLLGARSSLAEDREAPPSDPPATNSADSPDPPPASGLDGRLEHRGDRIAAKLDRRAARARARGHYHLAARLDRRGDRIDARLDRRTERREHFWPER